jgi:hypothetical protein
MKKTEGQKSRDTVPLTKFHILIGNPFTDCSFGPVAAVADWCASKERVAQVSNKKSFPESRSSTKQSFDWAENV